MAKYRYAKNENGEIVDIKNVSGHGDFICLGCGQLMNANIGQKNEHCFSHRNRDADSICRFETYLHVLGKEAFIKLFLLHKENGTPLSIASKCSCICCVKPCPYGRKEQCQKQEDDSLEIYPFYNEYKEEKWDYEYRPDVLLKSAQGNKIYIEICVSSPCTPQKISSGIPIIEFSLKDEDDLELFTDEAFAKTDNPKIKFYNYPKPPKSIYSCFNSDARLSSFLGDSSKGKTNIPSKLNEEKLRKPIDPFEFVLGVLYKNGRLEIKKSKIGCLYDFYKSKENEIKDYILIHQKSFFDVFKDEAKFDIRLNKTISEFFSRRYGNGFVKSCFLCLNMTDNDDEYCDSENVLCMFNWRKKVVRYTEANNCKHYDPMEVSKNTDDWSNALNEAYCKNRF